MKPFVITVIVLFLLCMGFLCANLLEMRKIEHQTPREKVFALANEIKRENRAAGVVLFALSGAMIIGDEGRFADIAVVYAINMADSIRALP